MICVVCVCVCVCVCVRTSPVGTWSATGRRCGPAGVRATWSVTAPRRPARPRPARPSSTSSAARARRRPHRPRLTPPARTAPAHWRCLPVTLWVQKKFEFTRRSYCEHVTSRAAWPALRKRAEKAEATLNETGSLRRVSTGRVTRDIGCVPDVTSLNAGRPSRGRVLCELDVSARSESYELRRSSSRHEMRRESCTNRKSYSPATGSDTHVFHTSRHD